MKDSQKTLISYYHGLDGPTIRIDAKSEEWLEYFKEIINSLTVGQIQEVDICCLDSVEIDNIKSITLVMVQRKKYSNMSMSNNRLTWLQDKEELITLIGLIDGLLEGCGSGHQYLDSEGSKVTIVLALNESE